MEQFPQLESQRKALQSALAKYVGSKYATEDAATAVLSASNSSMTAVVSGERINLRNYWSGRWTSKWQIHFADDSSVSVSGEIKVCMF